MYLACRHIKPNGMRCQSPALRGHAFCYFHSKVHSATSIGVMDDLRIPVPEDAASIQISIGRVFEALLSSRIDSKRSAQLLWGLQIALQTMPRRSYEERETVPSLTVNKAGEELAPVARVCTGLDNCKDCKYEDGCTNTYHYLYLNEDGTEADEDDEGEEKDED